MTGRVEGLEKELSNRGEQAADQPVQNNQPVKKPGPPAGGRTRVANRVVAPFQVVDRSGKPIFLVSDRGVDESTAGRVTIATGSSGGYVFFIRTAAGQMISILGEGPAGEGVLRLIGEKGQLLGNGGDGFYLMNSSGTDVGSLTFKGLGGALQLSSVGGKLMVEAGTVPAGVGVVRVGPNYACTGSPLPMGLGAPSCIMGMHGK